MVQALLLSNDLLCSSLKSVLIVIVESLLLRLIIRWWMYLRLWHASDSMQSKQWRQNIFCKQDSGSHLIHRKSSSYRNVRDHAGFVQSSSSITPASHTCSSNQHDFFCLHTCFAEVYCNKEKVLAYALLVAIISKSWVSCLLTKWCCWAKYCWTRNSHA